MAQLVRASYRDTGGTDETGHDHEGRASASTRNDAVAKAFPGVRPLSADMDFPLLRKPNHRHIPFSDIGPTPEHIAGKPSKQVWR